MLPMQPECKQARVKFGHKYITGCVEFAGILGATAHDSGSNVGRSAVFEIANAVCEWQLTCDKLILVFKSKLARCACRRKVPGLTDAAERRVLANIHKIVYESFSRGQAARKLYRFGPPSGCGKGDQERGGAQKHTEAFVCRIHVIPPE